MANNQNYRFTRGKEGYVTFDSKGYIVEAKGFGSLMWSPITVDKDLIGKHVDELAEMIKKYGDDEAYHNFEMQVHIELLKWMLKNSND